MGLGATLLRTIGQVADAAANVLTELPVKMGAVAESVPAGTGIADGDKVHLITDLKRRLRIATEYVEPSWSDAGSIGTDAYYPSEAGFAMEHYHGLTITGKIILGANWSSVLTVEVTNDEDATPGSRDWKTVYFDNIAAATERVASLAISTAATEVIALRLPAGYKYIRILHDLTAGGEVTASCTVILKARAEA